MKSRSQRATRKTTPRSFAEYRARARSRLRFANLESATRLRPIQNCVPLPLRPLHHLRRRRHQHLPRPSPAPRSRDARHSGAPATSANPRARRRASTPCACTPTCCHATSRPRSRPSHRERVHPSRRRKAPDHHARSFHGSVPAMLMRTPRRSAATADSERRSVTLHRLLCDERQAAALDAARLTSAWTHDRGLAGNDWQEASRTTPWPPLTPSSSMQLPNAFPSSVERGSSRVARTLQRTV